MQIPIFKERGNRANKIWPVLIEIAVRLSNCGLSHWEM